MKRKAITVVTLLSVLSTTSYSSCGGLMEQYNAPDPSVKTMRQLKRWIKRKVKDENKKVLEKCLIDRAADNPNKSTFAGR